MTERRLLTLILAESALETIPKEILDHPQVRKHAERAGKPAWRLLLNKSYHYEAMARLRDKEKRGRPDIVHFTLLEALGSPLNLEGLLKIYVHTYSGYVIDVRPEVRLPRDCNRFSGLMEQLFQEGKVPPEGKPLLTLRKQTLTQLIRRVKPTLTVALTRGGEPQPADKLAEELAQASRPTVIVGGFPHGTFSRQTLKLADKAVAIDREGLEAWIVTSRILAYYEQALNLPRERLQQPLNLRGKTNIKC
ncbi:MAG: 16S rRNA methyltransferase [Candidatus Hecatellaceae archaeon]